MSSRTKLIATPTLPAIATGMITLVVYLATMSRSMSFIDNGELAAAISTLGIAHPTGYPLFTLIGRVATMLPIPAEELIRANIFGAILTAVASSLFVVLLYGIARAHLVFPYRSSGNGTGERRSRLPAFVAGALGLAFARVVWMQSTSIEVYSLHLMLLVLLIASLVHAIQAQLENPTTLTKWFFVFSYLLGLSFSNHMTTLLIVPACIYLYVSHFGLRKDSLVRAGKLVPAFLLGLSTYVYLPIRASVKPSLMWGDPVTMERLMWHVSGKQYRSWIFSSMESAARQLNYFVDNFTSEFHMVILPVLVVGMIVILSKRTKLWTFLVLLFLGCLAYAINYDIHDIDSYFLLAYLVVAIIVSFGLLEIVKRAEHRLRGRGLFLGTAVCMIVPAAQVADHWSDVDQSDVHLVQKYVESIFNSLDSNAVVLTYQWDYFVSPALYEQNVRGRRRDVTIIDKELLRRSWYYTQIDRNDPEVLEGSRGAIDRFLVDLYKFEHGIPYDGSMIEYRFRQMINELIDRTIQLRPVYVGPEIESYFGAAYVRIPEGLLYRLQPVGEESPLDSIPDPVISRGSLHRLEKGLLTQYSNALTYRSFWLKNKGNIEPAVECARRALAIDPTNVAAGTILSELKSVRLEGGPVQRQ